jgi:membrane associated rhomboid family serine protease
VQTPTSSPRTSHARAGHLSPISINTWIIVINVAVFFLTGVVFPRLASNPYIYPKTFYGEARTQSSEVTDAAWKRRVVDGGVTEADPDAPSVVFYHPVLDPQPVIDGAGNSAYRVIGKWRFVEHMDILTALGHFSTGRAFTYVEIWRFVLFQFLHANLLHLLMNMMALWFFGSMVEDYLGRRRYLVFYLLCGSAGALFYLVLNLAGYLGGMVGIKVPGLLFLDIFTPLVGASAGVFGVLFACAYIAPKALVQIVLIPIPLKMRTLAYGYVVVAVVQLLLGASNAGGEASHIGGAIAGYWFIRKRQALREVQEFFVFGEPRQPAGTARTPLPPQHVTPVDPDVVDAVLEKVDAGGLDSLSEEDREVLRRHAMATSRRTTPQTP